MQNLCQLKWSKVGTVLAWCNLCATLVYLSWHGYCIGLTHVVLSETEGVSVHECGILRITQDHSGSLRDTQCVHIYNVYSCGLKWSHVI